jgi:hypothetical protein
MSFAPYPFNSQYTPKREFTPGDREAGFLFAFRTLARSVSPKR